MKRGGRKTSRQGIDFFEVNCGYDYRSGDRIKQFVIEWFIREITSCHVSRNGAGQLGRSNTCMQSFLLEYDLGPA